jgi:DNA-binding transcriptional MerR regulator
MKAGAAPAAAAEPEWLDRRLAEKRLGVGPRTVQRLARRGLIRTKIVPRASGGISYLYAEPDVAHLAEVRRAGKQWVAVTKAPVVAAEPSQTVQPARLAPLQQALEQLARHLRQPVEEEPYYVGLRRAMKITGLPRRVLLDAAERAKVRRRWVGTGERRRLLFHRLDLARV